MKATIASALLVLAIAEGLDKPFDRAPHYRSLGQVDGDTSHGAFANLARHLERCATHAAYIATHECDGAIFVWSPRMPLSVAGVNETRQVATELRIPLTVIPASLIESRVVNTSAHTIDATERRLAATIAVAGGLAHYPSLVVYKQGSVTGPAILGFKTAEAYRMLLADRAPARELLAVNQASEQSRRLNEASVKGRLVDEIEVIGSPGAYFRFVPRHEAISFAEKDRVYILRVPSHQLIAAPGYVDFIPSPDGRLFVTPARRLGGLEFYSAGEVFAERAGRAQPIFVDPSMRDQYPSVGSLTVAEGAATYRVLTSWRERAIFRDYSVRFDESEQRHHVEPIGTSVITCPDSPISLPILSPSGRYLAARDERTGTTKLFRLESDGHCSEQLDIGLSTGKIAWSPDERHIAFAISQGPARDVFGFKLPENQLLPGVFVMKRESGALVRAAASDDLNDLTFPDFAGNERLVFFARQKNGSGTFRFVCCLD